MKRDSKDKKDKKGWFCEKFFKIYQALAKIAKRARRYK